MRIELTKNIVAESVELIAEIDFYEQKSPYIETLQGISHETELHEKLKNQGLSQAAIKNVISRLEDLNVIKNDGSIKDLEKGFPEKEMGKYKITYYKNDTAHPFKYHIDTIERLKPTPGNRADQIQHLGNDFLIQLNKDQNQDSKTGKAFKIIKVHSDQGIVQEKGKGTLTMLFSDNKWTYQVSNSRRIELEEHIEINSILEGRWKQDWNARITDFREVENNESALKTFSMDLLSMKKKDIGRNWGVYDINLRNIPLIPNKHSREKWFIHLLKNEIMEENRYLTDHDIEQEWDNLFHTTPQIKVNGELPFNRKTISRIFKRNTEFYWLLQAGSDLNPFEVSDSEERKSKKPVIIIGKQSDLDLNTAFYELDLNSSQNLTIVDRYINTKRHFESLHLIAETFKHLSISVISTGNYKTSLSDDNIIDSLLDKAEIKRVIKNKKEITHDRFWKIDDRFYSVSKSLDFITATTHMKCNLEHTIFTKLQEGVVEPAALTLFRGRENE